MPVRDPHSSNSEIFVRYVLFVTLSMLILAINAYLHSPRYRPAERFESSTPEETRTLGPPAEGATPTPADSSQVSSREPTRLEEGEVRPGEETTPAARTDQNGVDRTTAEWGTEPPLQYVTLGSLDPGSRYRMLVTLSNQGAAVVRVELNDPRYRATEVRHGYLGHLAPHRASEAEECTIAVVGLGTPAAGAGLQPADQIVSFEGLPVRTWRQLNQYLQRTRPGQRVRLEIKRGEKTEEVTLRLGRQPVEVIRPELDTPTSFLLTLASLDDQNLEDIRRRLTALLERARRIRKQLAETAQQGPELAELGAQVSSLETELAQVLGDKQEEVVRYQFRSTTAASRVVDTLLERIDAALAGELELHGVNLRNGTWEVVEASTTFVTFRKKLGPHAIEVEKTYELAEVPANQQRVRSYPAYHLKLRILIRNLAARPRQVAYQLDGPNGLPTEGHWYAAKVGPGWGAYGLRDVAVAWHGGRWDLISCLQIADGKLPLWREEHGQRLRYVGVDAQYFSVILLPRRHQPIPEWYHAVQPVPIGVPVREKKNLTNTSCRLSTVEFTVPAEGGELVHEYWIFAGPKQPSLLTHYGLRHLVVYGWFWWVAIPMLWILHFLHDYVVFNYGLAIIVLTVLVRLAMFPLSWKQALAAQKMQQIQPELRRIYEKYKNDPQQRLQAQQELFRKYNYNPLGGCLILLLQLPIFIGLYRALMVDVELRAAPLISDAIRWCSDLSAPDMLIDWSRFWAAIGWEWFNEGYGLFALGPYFNILPVLTIALFLWQQKMLTPPPADEQAAMQQKVMTFVLIFMGVLFYKVASGLCLYFIASSIWGLAERRFLPKLMPPKEEATASPPPKEPRRKSEGWLERLRNRLELLNEESGRKKSAGPLGSRQLRRMVSKKTRKGPKA